MMSRSQNMGGELQATAGSHRKACRLLIFILYNQTVDGGPA
jgi:hypothetical protein